MITCLRFPFFPAAVEQRDHQPLRARPLVLGGQPWQRANVYSFSAEAAHSGVRLGATLRQAHLLCPDAAFRPPLTAHYNDVVRELFAYFLAWSDRVEPCSTRPAVVFYADLDSRAEANVRRLAGEMGQIARREVQLTPAIGAAATRFAAYLAAKQTRPGRLRLADDGLVARTPLAWLALDAALAARLQLFGLLTLGQLAALPAAAVQEQFGKPGAALHRLANGHDPRRVRQPTRAQEEAWRLVYDDPVAEGAVVQHSLRAAADDLAARLAAAQSSARRVLLSLLLADGGQRTAQVALSHPVQSARHLQHHLAVLLAQCAPDEPVAEIDARLATLRPLQPQQLTLFAPAAASAAELNHTLNDLQRRYGAATFRRPTALRLEARLLERRWQMQTPVVPDTTADATADVTLLA